MLGVNSTECAVRPHPQRENTSAQRFNGCAYIPDHGAGGLSIELSGPSRRECDDVSSTTYLTQFICTCSLCGRETMAMDVDGEIMVECGSCDNRRTFSRPQRRLSATIMAGRLQGGFDVDVRRGS